MGTGLSLAKEGDTRPKVPRPKRFARALPCPSPSGGRICAPAEREVEIYNNEQNSLARH